jgi:hypothetical protein
MAKEKTDFVQENVRHTLQENTQRATEAATSGMNWMTEIAERNLEQTRALVENLLTIANRMAEACGQQAAAVREHSMKLAEATSRHSFEFGKKIARIRDPEELAAAHSEFVSGQTRAVAEYQKKLGQRLAAELKETTDTTLHEARRRSEAA